MLFLYFKSWHDSALFQIWINEKYGINWKFEGDGFKVDPMDIIILSVSTFTCTAKLYDPMSKVKKRDGEELELLKLKTAKFIKKENVVVRKKGVCVESD